MTRHFSTINFSPVTTALHCVLTPFIWAVIPKAPVRHQKYSTSFGAAGGGNLTHSLSTEGIAQSLMDIIRATAAHVMRKTWLFYLIFPKNKMIFVCLFVWVYCWHLRSWLDSKSSLLGSKCSMLTLGRFTTEWENLFKVNNSGIMNLWGVK